MRGPLPEKGPLGHFEGGMYEVIKYIRYSNLQAENKGLLQVQVSTEINSSEKCVHSYCSFISKNQTINERTDK